MKRIMVVAGGYWQIPLVKKAKDMGLHVICTNLYPNSPAFAYADISEVADVLDREKNLRIAEQYHPDAIVTDQSDIAVPTVAYLNRKLGLRGIGEEKADLFTNKYKMRCACSKFGLPTPEFRLCRTFQEALIFLREQRDIIIKPVDNQASRGVFRIQSEEQLRDQFEKTLHASVHQKSVLVEQFIEGPEFTVDGVVCDGKHYSLAVSIKSHYHEYPNVASELYFSNKNPDYDYERLKEQNNRLVQNMLLPFGLTHAEYIWHNGNFYLVEIAARGGGTNISGKIVPIMSGIDNNSLLIKMALGESVDLLPMLHFQEYQDHHCVLKFFDFRTECVKAIRGEEVLKSNSNVLDYKFNFSIGETIKAPSDDSKRAGHFIAWGRSLEELEKVCHEIECRVTVE